MPHASVLDPTRFGSGLPSEKDEARANYRPKPITLHLVVMATFEADDDGNPIRSNYDTEIIGEYTERGDATRRVDFEQKKDAAKAVEGIHSYAVAEVTFA